MISLSFQCLVERSEIVEGKKKNGKKQKKGVGSGCWFGDVDENGTMAMPGGALE
jgi:hypothetical protein